MSDTYRKMNLKLLTVLLAVLAVAAILLVLLLPRAGEAKKDDPAAEVILNNEGLPLDTSASTTAAGSVGTDTESSPNIDPGTGMELEDDELPILTP